jgi:hypothetical protein
LEKPPRNPQGTGAALLWLSLGLAIAAVLVSVSSPNKELRMSKYHDELNRRLRSDDPSCEIADWYLGRLANEAQIMSQNLTTLERRFICDLAVEIMKRSMTLSRSYESWR